MTRLVQTDRKATVTQITTRYKSGMQQTISEHTTHQTLEGMDYSCRRIILKNKSKIPNKVVTKSMCL